MTNDDDDVLLVDPHADGSWKQWMLPYSSLILDSDPITKKALSALDTESTLLDVQKALDALLADKRDEYQQALNDHINNVFPRGTLELGDAIGLNYSLKFSKTSDSYTGYRFEYRSARSIGATTEAPSFGYLCRG
ncbi:hypothetical protein [Ornithinimicrobium sp. INDO-MA30-4]|uniref:hypothetical protein n=1 Tax=Ornithinimicrobium sp. INDO-MA30-4 TaxID=2908651 RepID=UPI001F3DF298|nr:hypothetical protein [Ornithinimicrobium sp. INDO-MA30-4]UJH70446.1 hypothetical protein L0A91_15260 [Ornithinimicrobium sp. INDO-MA30-4]